MKLEMVKVKGQENLYEHTELTMAGTSTYENGNHERFTARAFVGMYGKVSAIVTVKHPVSLDDTRVGVSLNKAAFDKAGEDWTDMDVVIPRLIDHANRKYYEGGYYSRCVGVEFDAA